MQNLHTYKTIYCANCGYSHKTLLYCGDRLCEICKKPNYHRLLSLYLPVIKSIKPYRLKQITLTHRNCPYLAKRNVQKIVADLKALRKTSLFKKKIKGGLAIIEVKHVSDQKGWNVHLHILVDSAFIPVRELSDLWYSITGDSFIVDVRDETESSRSLFHLLKYFLKTPVIQGVDVQDLRDQFNNAFRGFRSLISFGYLYNWRIEEDVYHFKCPNCGCENWLSEGELYKLEHRAVKLQPAYG